LASLDAVLSWLEYPDRVGAEAARGFPLIGSPSPTGVFPPWEPDHQAIDTAALTESLTTRIDQAVSAIGEPDDSAIAAVAVGHRTLLDEAGEW
jgi:hypothetical protein